jgi:hypothetical protein
MPIDWKSIYASAIREQDPAKIPDLCDEARRAINDRVVEQGKRSTNTPERRELEEALRQLVVHELNRTKRPSPESRRAPSLRTVSCTSSLLGDARHVQSFGLDGANCAQCIGKGSKLFRLVSGDCRRMKMAVAAASTREGNFLGSNSRIAS